ncbi:hypothetical protein GGR51DRAFT_533261 [Nemania sp. FL0031]|nr:hypothetical protein GGR51DRAFT_533261 [Nemania sp. FL0031]
MWHYVASHAMRALSIRLAEKTPRTLFRTILVTYLAARFSRATRANPVQQRQLATGSSAATATTTMAPSPLNRVPFNPSKPLLVQKPRPLLGFTHCCTFIICLRRRGPPTSVYQPELIFRDRVGTEGITLCGLDVPHVVGYSHTTGAAKFCRSQKRPRSSVDIIAFRI